MTTTAATQVRLVTVGRSALFHVEGLAPIGDYGHNAGSDVDAQGNDLGYVTYAPMSACGTLSSAASLYRSYVGTTQTIATGNGRCRTEKTVTDFTPAEAIAYAEKLGRKVCTRCAKAAQI